MRARGGRWGTACSTASRQGRRRGPLLLHGRVPLLSEPGSLAVCDLCPVGSCPVPRGPGAPASAHWRALPCRSGGHFLSTAERIRLPDDCTIGYIVEALLGVPLIRSGLFHSHLENLQQVPASELHEQVRWPGGPGRGQVGIGGLNGEVRRGLASGCWPPPRCRLPRRHGPPQALSSILPSLVVDRLACSGPWGRSRHQWCSPDSTCPSQGPAVGLTPGVRSRGLASLASWSEAGALSPGPATGPALGRAGGIGAPPASLCPAHIGDPELRHV